MKLKFQMYVCFAFVFSNLIIMAIQNSLKGVTAHSHLK